MPLVRPALLLYALKLQEHCIIGKQPAIEDELRVLPVR